MACLRVERILCLELLIKSREPRFDHTLVLGCIEYPYVGEIEIFGFIQNPLCFEPFHNNELSRFNVGYHLKSEHFSKSSIVFAIICF